MAPPRRRAAPLAFLLSLLLLAAAPNAHGKKPAPPLPAPAAPAPKNADLGVGFSGGGFLLPFLLGALDALREVGAVDASTPAAGASAGVFAVAASAGIVPLAAVRAEAARLGAGCRASGMCYGTLDRRVREAAARLLPADAAGLVTKRRGGAAIAVSFLDSRSGGNSSTGSGSRAGAGAGGSGSASSGGGSGCSGGRGGSASSAFATKQVLITEVKSRNDLIDAVAASAYLPLWSGPNVTTTFRGRRAYDGSWGAGVDGYVPCPPHVRRCLRITALPAGVTAGSVLFDHVLLGPPAAQRFAAAAVGQVLGAVTGGGGGRNSGGRSGGGRSAAPGVAALLAALPSPEAAAELSAVMAPMAGRAAPGEGVASVYPGRRCKLPVTVGEWALMQSFPPDAKMGDVIFKLGRAEALAWAEDEGLRGGGGANHTTSRDC